MSLRMFHFSEGQSHKFWSIALDGAAQTVRFGRIGTAGQTQTKTLTTRPGRAKPRKTDCGKAQKRLYRSRARGGQPVPQEAPAQARLRTDEPALLTKRKKPGRG